MLRFHVIATFAEAAWRIAPACYARSLTILRSALSNGAKANISDSRHTELLKNKNRKSQRICGMQLFLGNG